MGDREAAEKTRSEAEEIAPTATGRSQEAFEMVHSPDLSSDGLLTME
jgi:hypothetical protein